MAKRRFATVPLDNLLSDLVREQVLKNTREEVPHSVAVKIEKREEMKEKWQSFTAILATIIVERSTQKAFYWKEMFNVKKLSVSKVNMSKLIDGPVHPELFVKVVPNWRKESRLIEFGFEEEFR